MPLILVKIFESPLVRNQ